MFVKLQGWLPDADDTIPGVLVDVDNMLPTVRGYAGAPSPVATGIAALAAACRGATFVIPLDNNAILFAGTQTKLYKAGSTTWTDVTRTSSDYTGSSSSKWRFAQQGNVTIAVNKEDESQYYLHGTSTDFDDITDMPQTALVEAVGQFVLIGNYNDGTDTVDGWGCSAIGDYTDWTADPDTQCTYGRLIDTPGPVTGIKRLMDYAVYFKDRSIYLARYVGSPFIWDFTLVSDSVGCASNEAIVRVGTKIYFPGEYTFYSFDSATLQDIGAPVREWFNANSNGLARDKIQGLHDAYRGVIYWFFPAGADSSLTAWIAYSYMTDKWSKGDLDIETAVQYTTAPKTYDELDALYTTYNAYPEVSYDKLSGSGSTILPAVIDDTHTLAALVGPSDSSMLTTNDFGEDGSITLLSRLRPRYSISPDSAALTPRHRRNLGDTLTTEAIVDQYDGKFDCLQSDRWHRVKIVFTGDVEITGADVTVQPDGLE